MNKICFIILMIFALISHALHINLHAKSSVRFMNVPASLHSHFYENEK